MTATDTRDDLVPLRTDFDVVWRGYDRDQVQQYVHGMEADMRLVAIDRDAAVARTEDLIRQLEAARTENRALRQRIDRISRTPIEPDGLTERLRRMTELAHEEAADITTRARTAAEHSWATASQATDRLRRRAEHLVAELDRRRQEMETEHRELMSRAREQVEKMTRQAEHRRRELDEQAARLRRQVETDFEVAMAARRAEAMRVMAEQDRAAQARADRLIREATEHAHRIVADARHHLDVLRAHRDRLADGLRTAQQLLTDAEPMLHPLPEETTPEETALHPALTVAGDNRPMEVTSRDHHHKSAPAC
ncbi:hypothetical protein [Actinophytocola gossypii]|uniref:Cell division protein DivIVA n=1 Tax=Actinophytocola gossypii TaxID=2812003 RepID=A0ABT2JAI7_9PSEU|nr:hypothetical protein [Actinophytocola gossypii]MCT2584599.1 hypothetical protein [Actinophytocola gossypii]